MAGDAEVTLLEQMALSAAETVRGVGSMAETVALSIGRALFAIEARDIKELTAELHCRYPEAR
jgi:hypothetical protein